MIKNENAMWVISVTGETISVSRQVLVDETGQHYTFRDPKLSNMFLEVRKSEGMAHHDEKSARRRAIELLRERILEVRRLNEVYTRQLMAFVDRGEEELSLVDATLGK